MTSLKTAAKETTLAWGRYAKGALRDRQHSCNSSSRALRIQVLQGLGAANNVLSEVGFSWLDLSTC